MAEKVTAYCVKCKAKKELKEPKKVVRGGRNFLTANCPTCNTSMWRVTGKAK